jgi:membrane-associated phospholipid phosphatase
VSRRHSAALAVAAAYAALAGLVASGAATGLDQWAATHAMPGAGAPGPPPTFVESLVPLWHADLGGALNGVAQVVTLPGQVLVSLALVTLAAAVLRRRRRPETAAALVAAWALGTALEVVCKRALARPELTRHGIHLEAFDNSWPSGHTLRCVLVAAALAAAWPRARAALAAWLVAALALLELAGFHTPTDVAGGLLLAALLLLAVRELEGSALLRRRAGRAPRRARA